MEKSWDVDTKCFPSRLVGLLGKVSCLGCPELLELLKLDSWPFLRSWTWTAQVFFTLHVLSLFMKMHSYAFYNGHLSETKRRLDALDTPETASTAPAIKYPTIGGRLKEISPESDTGEEQSPEKALTQLREELAVELTSPLGHVTYAENLTFANFADFLCCPTLCYELEYPRTERIQWAELAYKTLAVFGCIFLLTITSDEFISPVLDESAIRLQGTKSLAEGGLILAETISRLLFPFMVTFLLVFLVIFEYVCGAFAELTCEFPPFLRLTLFLVPSPKLIKVLDKALPTANSFPTGGIRVTGYPFQGHGISLCTTSSGVTSIVLRADWSHGQLLLSLRS